MQTLPACRVYTLQVDEGCTASRALIETMLKPLTPQALENGQKFETLNPRWDAHPAPHVPSCTW